MPKIKTHKGAQARFSITGTGKVMRSKQGGSHLRLHKAKRTKRVYGDKLTLDAADTKRIKRLIPNGIK